MKRADRPGSIDFDRKGGLCTWLCCNFNPVHSCWHEPESYFYLSSGNVLTYGEEPGSGLYMCAWLPICCPLFLLVVPCVGTMIFPSYLCCGIWRSVNHNGLTFSVVDGAVQGRVSVKHCFTEDPAVILSDVQDIREELCRQSEIYIRGDEYSAGYTSSFAFYVLDILYRNESGQLMRYKTRELVASVHYKNFMEAVRQLVAIYRSKESSLVTFASVGLEAEPINVPVENLNSFRRSTYVPPVPQNIVVRGDSAVHPEATAPPATPSQYTAVQITSQPEYDMY